MIAHDGITADIDRENGRVLLEPLVNPVLAMLVVVSRVSLIALPEPPPRKKWVSLIALPGWNVPFRIPRLFFESSREGLPARFARRPGPWPGSTPVRLKGVWRS